MLRSIQRYTASACVVLGLVSGCGSSGGSPEVIAGGAQTSARPPLDPVVPGYVHTLDRSRFKIGKAPTLELSSPLLQRWRGSFGAFAVDPTNGLAMGVLDHDAPAGPYMLDAAGQSAKVKAYFIAAGIPADQIATVDATYNVGVDATPMAPPTSSAPIQLRSINSILRRAVAGIRVEESVAWAKMTVNGDVDAEWVYWPPIETSVVDAAVALAAKMADPVEHAAFIAKLPGVVSKDGGVVIHHSSPSVHEAPVAVASYDVTLEARETAPMRHFDARGNELRLAQETQLAGREMGVTQRLETQTK
jgi:hypothetical protein